MIEDPLLTTEEAAAVLRLSPNTLRSWRTMRRGPKFATIGRRIVYRRSDVERYIQQHFEADQ